MDSENTFGHRLKDTPNSFLSNLNLRTEEDCHIMGMGKGHARVQDGSATDVCCSITRPMGLRQSEKIHVPGLHSVNNGTQLSTLIT